MPYRGPDARRIGDQFSAVLSYNGETAVWRAHLSDSTGTTSAYFAGGGVTPTYREQIVTAMWAAPQMGESRFRETQLPGGQLLAGDVVASVTQALGSQDELIWRGVTYRVESDATPVHIGGRVWYRSVLRRGDVTG
jgi:hypothetical protein